jgi:hypothetical protein
MSRNAAKRVTGRTPQCLAGLTGLVAGLILLSELGSSGCVAAATAPPTRVIVVSGPPPAPLAEELTPQPQPASVWIAGYWHWNGIQYAWIPGHWEAKPRAGAIWRPPRYVKNEGSYVYEPGTWWTDVLTQPGLAPANGSPAGLVPGQANAFH